MSKLIREKLAKKSAHNISGGCEDLDRELGKNFWSRCRKIFDAATNRIPKFDLPTCFNYFKATLSLQNVNNKFELPNWIPSWPPPAATPISCPPIYQSVARAINKCKASSSACPLDQLSNHNIEDRPILLTLLHRIIHQ